MNLVYLFLGLFLFPFLRLFFSPLLLLRACSTTASLSLSLSLCVCLSVCLCVCVPVGFPPFWKQIAMDAAVQDVTDKKEALFAEIASILPGVSLDVDFNSVLNSRLQESDKPRGIRWLGIGSLRSLLCADGLSRILNDSTYGSVFRKKTDAIRMEYADAVERVSVHWSNDRVLHIVWGKDAFGYSYCTTYFTFRNALAVEVQSRLFDEIIRPRFENIVARSLGPGKVFDLEVDWDSFENAEEDSERALRFLYEADGRFSTDKVLRAIVDISRFECDPVVDVVSKNLKKLIFILEPGRDVDRKGYDYQDGRIKLKLVLESGSYNGIFDETDLRYIILAAGLYPSLPEFRLELLRAVCMSHRIRCWQQMAELTDLIASPSFYRAPREHVQAAESRVESGRFIKLFSNTIKQNTRGKKQKRSFMITTDHYYTMELKSDTVIKDSNFKSHRLEDIICIDIYPIKGNQAPLSKGGELAFTIYTHEPKDASGSRASKQGTPPSAYPGNSNSGGRGHAPSVYSVALDGGLDFFQSLNKLPDLPPVEGRDGAQHFRRRKEARPRRLHPITKGAAQSFTFLAEGLGPEKGNDLVVEAAWVLYAAYVAKTRRGDATPFLLPAQTVYDLPTEVEDISYADALHQQER